LIRGWNRTGLKKQENKKFGMTRRSSWPGKTRSKTRFNLFTFVFLLKQYRFDFLKKKIDLLKTRNLNRAGHQIRSKNYALLSFFFWHLKKKNPKVKRYSPFYYNRENPFLLTDKRVRYYTVIFSYIYCTINKNIELIILPLKKIKL